MKNTTTFFGSLKTASKLMAGSIGAGATAFSSIVNYAVDNSEIARGFDNGTILENFKGETDGHAILAQKLKDLYESLTFSGSKITDEEKKAIEELAKAKAGDDEILYKALRNRMLMKLAANKKAKETELEDKKSKAFKDMLTSADELLKNLK